MFAKTLRTLVKRKYQGKVPSANKIANDLYRSAPHLKPVSSETVRKWLTGACLPHATRLVLLSSWLGNELESAISAVQTREPEHKAQMLLTSGTSSMMGSQTSDANASIAQLVAMFEQLDLVERQMVRDILSCYLGHKSRHME